MIAVFVMMLSLESADKDISCHIGKNWSKLPILMNLSVTMTRLAAASSWSGSPMMKRNPVGLVVNPKPDTVTERPFTVLEPISESQVRAFHQTLSPVSNFPKSMLWTQTAPEEIPIEDPRTPTYNQHPLTRQVMDKIFTDVSTMASNLGSNISEEPYNKILQTAMNSLARIAQRLNNGEIDPTQSIRTSLDQNHPENTADRPLRIGVFPVAANPFHWAHLLIGLRAIAQHKLDKIVYVISGADERKPHLVSDEIRHPMAQDALDLFAPFFEYSSIAVGSDFDGETNIFRMLGLNPDTDIDAFYLVGGDHYNRFVPDGNGGLRADTIQKLEDNIGYRIYEFNPNHHAVSPIFILRGKGATEKIPTSLEPLFLSAITFAASSTMIRGGDFSIMPYVVLTHIMSNKVYGQEVEEETGNNPLPISAK